MLETLTIALGALRRSTGSSASVRRTTALKFRSMWRRTPSQPASANVACHAAPALLTRRSSRPWASSTAAATRAGASGSSRSIATTVAPPSSSASARSRSSRRATSTSCASDPRASRRAVAAPIPPAAPVIRATMSGGLGEVLLAGLDLDRLVASEVAHGHPAPVHLRERAGTGVLHEPLGPDHRRRAVLALGAEVPLAVSPQAALPRL